jgi:hypothetical protein
MLQHQGQQTTWEEQQQQPLGSWNEGAKNVPAGDNMIHI